MNVNDQLTLARKESFVELAFVLSSDIPIEGPRRLQVAIEVTRRAVEKAGGTEVGEADNVVRFRFDAAREKAVKTLVRNLRLRLKTIFDAPLSPQAVDRALGITSRERLRWYKDGRLPTSGQGVVGRDNHQIRHPLFPVEAIKRIAADPSIIENWREEDRRAQAAAQLRITK